MGSTVTLGGERLGGGKKQKIQMHGYERSTHDLSRIIRTTIAPGCLVPTLKEVALPGDTFDINIEMDIQTLPTIGALFGTYKIHTDVFQVPIRLYNASLHMNMLNIGLDMSKIFLPLVHLMANNPNALTTIIDNQQMNPSCIFKYLGVSGLGWATQASGIAERNFNAVPWLAYWDIYKNYYANKQEGIGAVIHQNPNPSAYTPTIAQLFNATPSGIAIPCGAAAFVSQAYIMNDTTYLRISITGLDNNISMQQIRLEYVAGQSVGADEVFTTMTINLGAGNVTLSGQYGNINRVIGRITINPGGGGTQSTAPKIVTFPLTDIDNMRLKLLQAATGAPVIITSAEVLTPYKYVLDQFQTAAGPPVIKNYATQYSLEGLGLRTYASDLYNNWVNTSYIDGATGITAVTSVNVVGNKFTLDELNLNKKVYEMLNRIAISGGTYDDWLDSVYTHERSRGVESPMYMGGAIRNIVFQEVIATTTNLNSNEPLGTLAGRGKLGNINKGGKIIIKVDEPSYIMAISSIVPNIDYYQGNDWDGNLKTMNDFHKPALDEIGFQNLITDQMAWWDTVLPANNATSFQSAGKQPAWINYMTAVNKVYGNFADLTNMNWMVLTRRYDLKYVAAPTTFTIADLTTYIDPSKFNQIFANTRIDAQNFMLQIGYDITARRKMSAKVIPNL